MKEKIKMIVVFGLGILVSSGVVYAATLYSATEVSYDNISSGGSETNVQGALDELYEKANTHCPDGYTCKKTTGIDILLEKANGMMITNYEDGDQGEMYTFSHVSTSQTPALIDYRYIGNVPNNYIEFNHEMWRIIGIFDGNIKLVKEVSIADLFWDYKKSGVGSSNADRGSNDWSDSQLMYFLNPTTYTLKTGYTRSSNYIRDSRGNIIYEFGCNPAPIASGASTYNCVTNSWKLDSTSLSQIETVTYYLGGYSSYNGSANDYYNRERGLSVYNGNPVKWEGKVGLIYPSDYVYTYAYGVDNNCFSNGYQCHTSNPSSGWLYDSLRRQWMISAESFAGGAFMTQKEGNVYGVSTYGDLGVRPVVYLKSDILITGSGKKSDPYKIVE